MYSYLLRLIFPCLSAAMLLISAPSSARAQFAGAGGLVAPAVLPSPVFGYGGLGYGYGYGMGMGWGTQWMQNPYEGYLNGAANLTTANAQYQLTIQQAKLARQEAIRSSIQTRRQSILERQWELSLQPDPEQIRQQQMMRSLQRSRNNPPLNDIWSGTALNDLLRAIQTAQSKGSTGPEVPLSPEVLRHINVTSGTTSGGIGLLRDGGKLTWPYVLQQSSFEDERKKLDGFMTQAVKEARSGQVSRDVLNNIRSSVKQLERALDAQVAELTPSDFIEGSRYVRELKDAAKVLQQSDVSRYFRTEWTPQGSTVGDLIRQMTQQGLRFAPAVSGDQSYYTTLHRAMVDYDVAISQMTSVQPAQLNAVQPPR